jgi:hypothetical protein
MRAVAAAVLIGAGLIAGAVIWSGSTPTPVTVTVEAPRNDPIPSHDPWADLVCEYNEQVRLWDCTKGDTPQW